MPWSGGVFSRNQNFQADRDASIKILASHVDNEFDNFATGLQNCITRDNETPPTTDISWGGFKLTNLAAGAAASDAVRLDQVTALVGEWVAETASFAWVAATQFKLTGANRTATYHVGRRVKIVHNTGGTTSYATITASVFSTDTTVTVVVDGGAALVSTITALSYGIVSFVNPSHLAPASLVFACADGTQSGVGTSATKVTLKTEVTDALSEFDPVTNYRFTALYPGYYRVSLDGSFWSTAADVRIHCYLYKNGVQLTNPQIDTMAGHLSPFLIHAGSSALLSLVAGDFLECFALINSGTMTIELFNFVVQRVGSIA